MTTRRSPPTTTRAQRKKKAKKKVSPSVAARSKAKKKKSAANKKAHAKKIGKKATRRKATKTERKATRSTRRKATAPDMSMYVRDGRKLTDLQILEAKGTIVRMLSMKGNVREATDAAGITRTLSYEWRKKDEAFREAWDNSLEEAWDRMEEEIWRRGIEGFDRPVIYQGEITDTYTEYSDSLLSLLARGNKPGKYKERTEHSGSVGRPLELNEETKKEVVSSILGLIENKPDPEGAV